MPPIWIYRDFAAREANVKDRIAGELIEFYVQPPQPSTHHLSKKPSLWVIVQSETGTYHLVDADCIVEKMPGN